MAAKTKDGWPVEVPVLTGKDIYQGGDYYSGPKRTKCCLVGWVWKTFGTLAEHKEVFAAIDESAHLKGGPIPPFNDCTPPNIVASAWNRAMARLGYVVGNPESRPERET